MANSTIPNLVAVSVPALTDLFGVRQSGDARDKKLTATQLQALIASGDVVKVGTPVDGQIGVWTGDGTIEGTNDLVFNGGVFKVVASTESRFTGDLKLQTGSGQAPMLRDVAADETTPSLCPAVADSNTGIGWKSADRLAFIAGGKRAMVLAESNSIGVIPAYDTGTGLTAFAGGGQGSAITLDRGYNVVTTVATTADSAKLPTGLAFLVGSVVYLKNNGVNSLDLFPGSGDDLGAGVDTAIAVAAGASVAFIGTTEGSIWTQLIFAAGGGGGDVSKVGTPVNDQIGVWTGDGTIEGVASLRYNSSLELFADSIVLGDLESVKIRETLVNTIAFRFSNFDRWRMNNDSFASSVSDGAFLKRTGVSGSVPSLVPRSGDENTGIGSAASDQISVVAGGIAAISVVEAASVITISLVGTTRGTSANAFGLINENASATNPTILPNRADEDTGIGQNAVDQVSIIAGGLEIARLTEVGGLPNLIVDPSDANTGDVTLSFGGGGSGFRQSGTALFVKVGGVSKFAWDADLFVSALSDGAGMLNESASGTNPTLVPDRGDLDTGIGSVGNDQLSLIAGGVEIARATEAAVDQVIVSPGAILGSAALPSLAFGDGDSGFRESVDDAIKVTLVGVDRWTFTADRFVAVAGNGPSLQNEASTATNPTLIPALGDVSTGIGGVTTSLSLIVGGAERIHLDTSLATANTFTGDWKAANATGPALIDEAASATNPTLVPTKGDEDTGVGSNGADTLSLIAGGVEMLRLEEGTTDQVLIGPDGSAADPALSFISDPDTGLYSVTPGIIAMSVDGIDRFRWVGNQFRGATGGSPSIQNEVASASNPTLLPTQSDLDTGIGWTGTDQLALVAGGLDCMTVRETASARQIGFYTTAPISLQTGVAVSAAAIHAALVALGLITA
jgi:hypothetical protein